MSFSIGSCAFGAVLDVGAGGVQFIETDASLTCTAPEQASERELWELLASTEAVLPDGDELALMAGCETLAMLHRVKF